jgi:hypothetical protein
VKDEIQDLARKLEQGEIDKAAFDRGVGELIASAGEEPAPPGPAEPAGEAHAVRSRAIRFAAKRARDL